MTSVAIHWPSVAAFLSVIGIICGFAVWLRPILKSVMLLLEDWNGTPARPGVARRPGVMERLDGIERQLSETNYHIKPNHGMSSYDHQTKLLEEINGKLDRE